MIETRRFVESVRGCMDEIRHCLLKIQRSSESLHTQEKGVD